MSQYSSTQPRPQLRGFKLAAAIIAGVFGVCGLTYAADYLLTQDQVPRGTTVAGVSIGGMNPDDARAKLEAELARRVGEPVMVIAGAQQTKIDPAVAGLTVNWDKTIESAGAPSLNPFTRIASFFTEQEVGIISDVSEAKLAPELERVVSELTIAPVDASVNIDGGKVSTTEPVDGQDVDPEVLREKVEEEWLNPAGVSIEPKVTEPAIGGAAMKKAAEGPAAKAVSGPIVVKGRDNAEGIIPVDRMAEVVKFVPEDGQINAKVDPEIAKGILLEGLGKTEKKKQNAEIDFTGGGRNITPSVDGVKIDWEKVLDKFPERVIGDEPRTFDAVYIDEKATFTTEMAEKAKFDDTVGTFTTGGFTGPSGVNIARTAEMVDGAIVAPGDTFSLNSHTGPRGEAQGFVESGIIMDGHADKAVGGGISQFATTLYNAYYFAGMEDVTHTPHSYYISRYPAGREATVFDGLIDLAFKNNSKYPVMIEAKVSGEDVTVSLKGVKTVEVESIPGPRTDPTEPKEMKLPKDNCIPSEGAPGFTTTDTRVIKSLSGEVISKETTTTVYDPQPIVKCEE